MTLGPPSNHRSISGGLFLRYTYMYRPPLQTNRRCRSKGQEKEKAICYRQKLDRYRPACFFFPRRIGLCTILVAVRAREILFSWPSYAKQMTTTRGGRDTTYTLRRESALPIQDILDPAFFDAQFLVVDSKKKERKKTICILCLSFFTSVVEQMKNFFFEQTREGGIERITRMEPGHDQVQQSSQSCYQLV